MNRILIIKQKYEQFRLLVDLTLHLHEHKEGLNEVLNKYIKELDSILNKVIFEHETRINKKFYDILDKKRTYYQEGRLNEVETFDEDKEFQEFEDMKNKQEIIISKSIRTFIEHYTDNLILLLRQLNFERDRNKLSRCGIQEGICNFNRYIY